MSASPNVLQTTDEFRNQLIQQERQAEAELARAYNRARDQLQDSLDNVTQKIVELQNAGETPKPWMLYEQANYVELIEQVEDEIQRLADDFGATVDRMRGNAIQLGDEMAAQLLGEAGVPVVVRLPNDELIEMLGRLRVGSPVDELLQKLGPEAAELIKDKLTAGLVSGWSPLQVASEISNALGTSLSHARRIARTEMLQAYRNAALLNYNRYPNIIGGWIWTAAVGSATPPCPMCAGLHGQVFPLDQPFGSHPNCRCSPAPLRRGGRVPFDNGNDWFRQQPPAIQQDVLGQAEWLAYQDGVVDLSDFSQLVNDPAYGPQYQKLTLNQILGNDADQYFRLLKVA